jgi:hypothetical protein
MDFVTEGIQIPTFDLHSLARLVQAPVHVRCRLLPAEVPCWLRQLTTLTIANEVPSTGQAFGASFPREGSQSNALGKSRSSERVTDQVGSLTEVYSPPLLQVSCLALSVPVAATADFAACGSQQRENRADDDEDDADGPKDSDLGHEADDEQNDAEDDHRDLLASVHWWWLTVAGEL